MPADPKQLKSLFLAAVEKPTPEERAAFLDAACGTDQELRRRAEALLRAHDEPGGLAGVPDCAPPAAAVSDRVDLSFLAPPAKPGSLGRLDHYEVLAVVGKGGMGVVLKVFDEKLHRVVAVKVLAPALASNGTARKRFVREAQAAAAVTHDHVIDIHAVEEAGPVPYLVMQFIDGLSLEEKIKQAGPLKLKEILRIGLQMAEGLAAAHRQGLVHRDVKPANILLENGVQRVKITDFGLARAVDDANLTQSGLVAGTPLYMAPEQARGEVVDQRADLFSLGSVLYALCTGRPAFRAGNSLAVLKRVCEDTPRPIAEVNPDIPDWLAAIVSKLLAKDPAQRFQTAAEVADLLGQYLARLQQPGMVGNVSRVAGPQARGKRTPPAAVLALVAVAVLVGCIITSLILRPSGEAKPADGANGAAPGHPRQRVALPPWQPRPVPSPEELARRPAAADALKRADIPAELLKMAGGGDAEKAPTELVAVLGEDRHQGQANQPCHLYTVAISPDGKTLASGGTDKLVRLWDLATGKVRQELTGHQQRPVDTVYTLAFSPDGKLLASGDRQGTIFLWDTATGTRLATLSEPGGQLNRIVFSPDSKLLGAARQAGCVQLWEVPAGKLQHTLEAEEDLIWNLAFSPDAKTLASGGGHDNKVIRLWDVATGSLLNKLRGHTAPVRCLAFHPDGRTLASSGHDNLVRIWNLATGQEKVKLSGHDSPVLTCAWRADGRLLATAGQTDGTVRLWDPSSNPPRGKVLAVIPPKTPWVQEIPFSPEGRHLAVTNPNGTVYVLRLAKPGEVLQLPAEPEK